MSCAARSRTKLGRTSGVLLAAGLLLGGRPGRAELTDAPREVVHVSYRAPAACGDPSAFLTRVTARTARFQVDEQAAEARLFAVVIRERGRRYEGELSVQSPGLPPEVRRLSGRECPALLDALALMMALAIDPLAQGPVAAAPVATSSAPAVPAAAPLAAADALAAGPRLAAPRRVAWSGGALGSALPRLAPTWLLGVRGSLEVAAPTPGIAPALRIAAGYARSFVAHTADGDASFRLVSGSLEMCAIGLPQASLGLAVCADFQAGQLLASGSRAPAARRAGRLWLAAGPSSALRLRLERALWLELGGALWAPLTRDRFGFGDAEFHRVPWLSPELFLGLRGAITSAVW